MGMVFKVISTNESLEWEEGKRGRSGLRLTFKHGFKEETTAEDTERRGKRGGERLGACGATEVRERAF